jgi:hypothetical protein
MLASAMPWQHTLCSRCCSFSTAPLHALRGTAVLALDATAAAAISIMAHMHGVNIAEPQPHMGCIESWMGDWPHQQIYHRMSTSGRFDAAP